MIVHRTHGFQRYPHARRGFECTGNVPKAETYAWFPRESSCRQHAYLPALLVFQILTVLPMTAYRTADGFASKPGHRGNCTSIMCCIPGFEAADSTHCLRARDQRSAPAGDLQIWSHGFPAMRRREDSQRSPSVARIRINRLRRRLGSHERHREVLFDSS